MRQQNCAFGAKCSYAHSQEEMNVWSVMKEQERKFETLLGSNKTDYLLNPSFLVIFFPFDSRTNDIVCYMQDISCLLSTDGDIEDFLLVIFYF